MEDFEPYFLSKIYSEMQQNKLRLYISDYPIMEIDNAFFQEAGVCVEHCMLIRHPFTWKWDDVISIEDTFCLNDLGSHMHVNHLEFAIEAESIQNVFFFLSSQ